MTRSGLQITGFDGVVVTDRRYAEPVYLPVAISELSFGARLSLPAEVTLDCRDDLVEVDGEPVALRLSGNVEKLLDGEPFDVTRCSTAALALAPGDHRISASTRSTTGLQVDRVVLTSPGVEPDAGLVPTNVVSRTRTSARVTLGPCPDGCWFVFGEGYNEAWTASIVPAREDDEDDTPDPGAPTDRGDTELLGAGVPVDGGFNGWYVPPTRQPMTVTVEWTAQGLRPSGCCCRVCSSPLPAPWCCSTAHGARRRRSWKRRRSW